MKLQISLLSACFILLCVLTANAANILKDCRINSSKGCEVEFTDNTKKIIKCSGVTPTKKGSKYFTLSIDFAKALDMRGKQLTFNVRTTTPQNLQALYVRFFNEGEKKSCWSFMKWNSPVKKTDIKVKLAAQNAGVLKWEPSRVNNKEASRVNRIKLWIGTSLDNVPMDMYLSNFSITKAPLPQRDIWTKYPQKTQLPAKVEHPGGFLKPADIERAKANLNKYAWAKELYQRYKLRSKFWMNLSDEQIKQWIPEEDAFFKCLCPNCFTQPEFAWRNGIEPDGKSIKCTKCKHVFPSAKFPENSSYTVKSPHGKLKTIPYYKGPNQMIHHENIGPKYHISGAINWAKLRNLGTVASLAYVYALNKDIKYANKVKKILLRFAEVYPHYSPKFRATIYVFPKKHRMAGKYGAWKFHDSGKILQLANAYDITYNSGVYNDDDKVKIENGIFREYKWLITMFPPTKDWCANAVPAHMTAAAMCAAMLGDHDLMSWTLEGPEGFKAFINKHYTRDGFYNEFSPAYTSMANTPLIKLIDILQGYSDSSDYKGKNPYKNLDIFNEVPKLKEILSSYNSLVMPNGKLPPVNDSDLRTELPLSWLEFNNNYSPNQHNTTMLSKEKKRSLWHYNYSLFKRKKLTKATTANVIPSTVFTGPGWAVLRQKNSAQESALLLNFNTFCPHWHYAILNYLYYDFNQELVTDLGYLSWQHPHLRWMQSPLAHNGVIVDGQRQANARKTQLEFWGSPGSIQMVSASAPDCYPSITKKYNRTIFNIQLSGKRQYIADFFKVSGGKEHLFSFHADGEIFNAPKELKFTPFNPEKLGSKNIGWAWLKNSRACTLNTENTKFTWINKNKVKSCLYWPVDGKQEIILANAPGARFRNKPYDKTRINLIMSRKKGPNNVFVSVLEATKTQELISEVTYLKTQNNDNLVKVIRVKHSNGTDIIAFADKSKIIKLIDYPLFELIGQYAVVRLNKANKLKTLWLGNGESLKWGNKFINGAQTLNGTITAVDRLNKKLITDLKTLPQEVNYSNNYLIVPGQASGEYRIKNITKENNKIVISIDKKELINLQAGNKFFIPIHKQKSLEQ
jgi:Heparinase II/III-like protein